MKVRAQTAIYIFIAVATLDVCSIKLISRAGLLKRPQTTWPADPARCSTPRAIRPYDHRDSQYRVLASTLFEARTLQIP
jgi:hypothetical protein